MALKILCWLLLWINLLSLSLGDQTSSEFRFPFIKLASTFSSSSSSSSSISSKDKDNSYDYIIVGGGTAGCPLAATLSQNFSVLLLERGGVPFANSNVSFLRNFHIALADISPESASQAFVSTDGVINARARVLGGGTCINAGFYTRADSRFMKRAGWDPEIVNKSYPWVEKLIVRKPKVAPWQRAVRDSLLEAGISPDNGFTYDHKYGTKFGGTIFDRFGRRHTAAELLAYANPQNISVLIHATVQKIVFDTTGKKPRAVGVIFKDEKGTLHQANIGSNPKSEVILSCGAIGTPQMLMLSGIGDKQELQKHNISSVLDNKYVGKGMADNPMNSLFVPSNRSVEQSLIQTVGITKLGVYVEASSGFGQSQDSIQCHHGIMSAEIGQLSTLPPKQRTPEAIQAYIRRKKDLPHEAFKGGFILEKIAKPLSTGHLNLVSTNVDENPNVTFNYFSHPQDLKRCVEGIRLATKLVQSKRFTNFMQCDKPTAEKILNMSIAANVNLVPKHPNNTKSLEQFCRDTVITIWHYHGGAHIGKVVDTNRKVLGMERLRIVDGSTFDVSPGTNPQATVMMMGRYMGVEILRNRLGKKAGV
ncbi:hypothetical protein ACFE04_008441 [Oxalis oulophora]